MNAHGKRILVIEDDPDSREILREVLGHNGYQAVATECREDALSELARDRAIGLILMDLMMPGMTADVFCGELEKRGLEDLPLVIISAAAEVDVPSPKVPCRRLRKPLELAVLMDTINEGWRDPP